MFIGSAGGEQCSSATWRVFCYGVITALMFLTLVTVVTIIALRTGCLGTCFRRKSHTENHISTPGSYTLYTCILLAVTLTCLCVGYE